MPLPEIGGEIPMSLGELIIRVSLAFWVLLVLTRIMGRKQVAQLTFFDYVTGISIGSIAAALAIDKSISLTTGLSALLVWVAWVMIVNFATLKSIPARKYIDGEPIMVIHNGRILEQNLGSKYYNIDDLMMELRENGIFDPNEVQVGIAEPDGKLSVLKKTQFQPVTNQDADLPDKTAEYSYNGTVGKELIIDGAIIIENLKTNNIAEEWLQQQLAKQNITDISQVMVAILTPQGNLYVDKKPDKAPKSQRK